MKLVNGNGTLEVADAMLKALHGVELIKYDNDVKDVLDLVDYRKWLWAADLMMELLKDD
jgi:hypothetical protein